MGVNPYQPVTCVEPARAALTTRCAYLDSLGHLVPSRLFATDRTRTDVPVWHNYVTVAALAVPANLTALTRPDSVMMMAGGKSMGNLMQDSEACLVRLPKLNQCARQRDFLGPVPALTCPALGIIEHDFPIMQAMHGQQCPCVAYCLINVHSENLSVV
jgi:hypothetical protein